MQSLPASDLVDRFNAISDHLDSTEHFIQAETISDTDIQLIEYSFEGVVELGRSLEVDTFYGVLDTAEDGTPQWARVFFFHNGHAHVQYVESEEIAEIREDESDEQVAELEQKRNLAEEILEQYPELLGDATEYRLTHNVGEMTMERLFRLQDRLQEEKEQKEREERIDEDLEMRLAEAVYEDDRFHGRFNSDDVEMLLEQLDVEFDDEEVRIAQIDRKAKSLLKLEE